MIICFDLETTGLSPKNDKIIEIAMIKFDEKTFEIIDTFSSFVNPEIEIPELITNITNISEEDVKNAPTIDEIRAQVVDFIGFSALLGHNVDFDINFLIENNVNIAKNPKIDTFFLANFLSFDSHSLNLEMLCKYYKIEFSGAHRAINDTKATIKLFEAQIKAFKKLKKLEKDIISYILSLSEDENIQFLSILLTSTDTKIQKMEILEEKMLKKIGKLDLNKMKKENKLDNLDILKSFKKLKLNETRENQLKMAEKVYQTLDKNEKIVIEAATGLGKSFAYLIPAINSSLETGEKVYISTKTKTLQDQLYFKDLEFLKEKLDLSFSFTKLKGKRNYISLKGFFDFLFLGDLNFADTGLFLKLCLWLLKTEHGELDELVFYPQEYNTLKYLNSDFLSINTEKNPYKDYEFLQKARKKVEISDIIIINHSLLFSDFENETPILTNLKNLVIDEAHNIEDSVTDTFKKRYSLASLTEVFDKCEKILTKRKLKKIDFLNLKDSITSKLQIFDEIGNSYVNLKEKQDQNFKTTLITEDFYEELDFTALLKKINLAFLDLVDNLKQEDDYDFSKEINFFIIIQDTINVIFKKNLGDNFIKIANYNKNYGTSFDYTLLSPANYLKEKVWDKLDSCVLTSATLTINEDFSYFTNTLSLADFKFEIYESDFDYKSQATLFIPNDLGDIKSNSSQILHFLDNFYKYVHGNTLTLLTSFSMIKSIYLNSNINVKKMGSKILAQSIGGSKNKLIGEFLENPESSILLGTTSFWEGVDISGEDLKYLIIHKFPFSVPTDPIFLARSKFFKDPFKEYSIPKAIIMLKQGFGRLIRTKNDKGIVVLLDNRIISTRWGEAFNNAFPKTINKKICSAESFLNLLQK